MTSAGDRVPGDTDGDSDEVIFARYGEALADAVERSIGPWVRESVARRVPPPWSPALVERVEVAAADAAVEIGTKLRDLLALDIDDQWTNPLSVIRSAVRYPTDVLGSIDAPHTARDDHARAISPDDVYDLTPGGFDDLGPHVHDLGIRWGAAKAHIHLRRRREEEVA